MKPEDNVIAQMLLLDIDLDTTKKYLEQAIKIVKLAYEISVQTTWSHQTIINAIIQAIYQIKEKENKIER